MKWFIGIISTLLLLIGIGTWYILDTSKDMKTYVRPGVSLDGQDISGKTAKEVKSIIEKKVNTLNKGTLTLQLEGTNKTFNWNELGINYKASTEIVDTIFESQQGSPLEMFMMSLGKGTEELSYEIEPVFDEKVFDKLFEEEYKGVTREAVDATFRIKGSSIIIDGGQNGKRISRLELKKLVLDANLTDKPSVIVPLEEFEPNITKDDIKKMGLKDKIATYTTKYNPSDKNKIHNIGVSSDAISGKLLAPGEIFDYFGLVGRPTESRGYKEGNAYVNGELVSDIGGGICQVSSTIYNAALLSGMEIVERHNHGLPVYYVPAGRDATLWYGSKNFKFKNTSKYYVYVQIVVEKTSMTVNFYGTKSDKTYSVESEITSYIDPAVTVVHDSSVAAGKEEVKSSGAYGYKSEAYRIVKKNGAVVSRELLSKDTYKAKKKVVHKNTKAVVQEEAQEDNSEE